MRRDRDEFPAFAAPPIKFLVNRGARIEIRDVVFPLHFRALLGALRRTARYEPGDIEHDPHDHDADKNIAERIAPLVASHIPVEQCAAGERDRPDEQPNPPVSNEPLAHSQEDMAFGPAAIVAYDHAMWHAANTRPAEILIAIV